MLCRATWDKHQGQSGGRKSHRQINSKSRYYYSNGKTTSIGQKQNMLEFVVGRFAVFLYIYIHMCINIYISKHIQRVQFSFCSVLIYMNSVN